MNIVFCENEYQLKAILLHIFFDAEDSPLTFEEIQRYLELDDNDFTNAPENSDDWFDQLDNSTIQDMRKFVLNEEISLLKRFKPGLLIWSFADDFDRMGWVSTRIFEYVVEEDLSFDSWLKTI